MDWFALFGLDMRSIPVGEALFRLAMAVIGGGIIGIDREFKKKPAGLRAFIIITVATAAYAVSALEMAVEFNVAGDASVDPSRHYQGILGAFGFLGAGAIIQGRGGFAGIATGASIFASGAVGTAIGFGQIWLGLLLAILCVGTLRSVEKMQHERSDLIERDNAEALLRKDDDG